MISMPHVFIGGNLKENKEIFHSFSRTLEIYMSAALHYKQVRKNIECSVKKMHFTKVIINYALLKWKLWSLNPEEPYFR